MTKFLSVRPHGDDDAVKTCPSCGNSGLPDEAILCPRCRRALDNAPVAVARTDDALPATYACGHGVEDGRDRCRHCEGDPHRFALETPWGTVPVLDTGLQLGRDSAFSQHAAALAAADNLSRRHATLRPTDDGVLVEDQNSANGTFIDAIRLTPWQAELAREGAEIRLGADPPLVMRVVST